MFKITNKRRTFISAPCVLATETGGAETGGAGATGANGLTPAMAAPGPPATPGPDPTPVVACDTAAAEDKCKSVPKT